MITLILITVDKEEESVAGRLVLWLRSLVPASASPPKTTATDHFWFSVERSTRLHIAASL